MLAKEAESWVTKRSKKNVFGSAGKKGLLLEKAKNIDYIKQ